MCFQPPVFSAGPRGRGINCLELNSYRDQKKWLSNVYFSLFIYYIPPHARSGTGGHDGAGFNRCLSLTLVPPVRRPF